MCGTSVWIHILSSSPAPSNVCVVLCIVGDGLCNTRRAEFAHLLDFFVTSLTHEDILLVSCGRGGDERKKRGKAYKGGEGARRGREKEKKEKLGLQKMKT